MLSITVYFDTLVYYFRYGDHMACLYVCKLKFKTDWNLFNSLQCQSGSLALPSHAKCSQAVKQTPRLWCALGLDWQREKKCVRSNWASRLVVCLLTGAIIEEHEYSSCWQGNWFLGAALRWLACQSPTNEGLDQVGRQNGKVKKNPLHPLLRASQLAKPNFLKVTLNSNPSSLIPGSNTGFWFLLQRWRLEKALLLGNTWKAISNRW